MASVYFVRSGDQLFEVKLSPGSDPASFVASVSGASPEASSAAAPGAEHRFELSALVPTNQSPGPGLAQVSVAGRIVELASVGKGLRVRHAGRSVECSVLDRRPTPEVARTEDAASAQRLLRAPIPGHVAELLVEAGDRVTRGTALLTLEAMKMQNPILADEAGTVVRFLVEKGDTVQADAPLVEIHTGSAEAPS